MPTENRLRREFLRCAGTGLAGATIAAKAESGSAVAALILRLGIQEH